MDKKKIAAHALGLGGLTVRTADELAALPRDGRANGFFLRQTLVLALPSLSPERLRHWQEKVDRLQARCGCAVGALCMLVTLACGATASLKEHLGFTIWDYVGAGLTWLGAAFGAAIAGKFVTMAVTQWQFTRTCALLLAEARGRTAQ